MQTFHCLNYISIKVLLLKYWGDLCHYGYMQDNNDKPGGLNVPPTTVTPQDSSGADTVGVKDAPSYTEKMNVGIDTPASPQIAEVKEETPTATPPTPQSTTFNPQPEPQPETAQALTTGGGGSNSKFGFFVILGIIVAVLVWGGVTYLYLDTQSLKKAKSEKTAEVPQEPTPIPTPSFSPDQIQIKNGSVVQAIPNAETTTLVDKADYKTTGITGFAKVLVSPDNSFICFEAWPPAPAPALYVATIKGESVVKVGENYKSCIWNPDSKSILYINSAPLDKPTNIFSYELSSGIVKNVTEKTQTEGERAYSIVGLSADATKLICRYVDLESVTNPKNEVTCQIDLKTFAVTNVDAQTPQ